MRMRKNRLLSGTQCALVLALATFPVAAQTASPRQWTWMGGSNTGGSTGYLPGVYGTAGTAAPGNIPPSRVLASAWTDSRGHLWLFGGFLTTPELNYLNDLWEFNPSTDEWAWMGGSNSLGGNCPIIQSNASCGQHGNYGTLGTSAAANIPGGRFGATSWTDKNGNLWLFGGAGFDSLGQLGVLNDLWEFNPTTNHWTWVGGSSSVPGDGYGQAGVFGSLGTPAATNHPGGLEFAVSWPDPSGNAWLFGGWGDDINDLNGLPNTLWKYDSSLGQWAWVEGSSSFGTTWVQPSVYGNMGISAPGNIPGSRWQGTTWTDASGHLWMFGGQGFDSQGNSGFLNELWRFDAATNEWAWMGGNSTMTCAPGSDKQNCGQTGAYGTLGTPAAENFPGGRTQAASWTDSAGHFWLFGGAGFNTSFYSILNDLWEFDPSTGEWTWMAGNSGSGSGAGKYGTLGVPAPSNLPGSRTGAAAWTDGNGNFWLFGGNALDATGNIGLPNDMWTYQPAKISVPAADFSLISTPTSLTLTAGQSGTAAISITPLNGFNSAVSFTCSGLPAGTFCNFAPATVTPAATAAATTLTITTSVRAAAAKERSLPLLPDAALAAAVLCLGRRSRRRFQLLLLGVGLFGVGFLTGCGYFATPGTPSSPPPTISTITVTAVAGSLQHSTTLSLTVQ